MIMDIPPTTPIMIPRIIPSQLDVLGAVVWPILAAAMAVVSSIMLGSTTRGLAIHTFYCTCERRKHTANLFHQYRW
jgi:hypothetical protein